MAINHGVGGDTTHDMINRLNGVLTELKGYEKPLALVTLGINDIPRIDDNHAARKLIDDKERSDQLFYERMRTNIDSRIKNFNKLHLKLKAPKEIE